MPYATSFGLIFCYCANRNSITGGIQYWLDYWPPWWPQTFEAENINIYAGVVLNETIQVNSASFLDWIPIEPPTQLRAVESIAVEAHTRRGCRSGGVIF